MSLSIIYEYEENNIKYYKCKCDCGNYIDIKKENFQSQINCGNCPTSRYAQSLRIRATKPFGSNSSG